MLKRPCWPRLRPIPWLALLLAFAAGNPARGAQPGSLDTTFNPANGVDQSVFAVLVQPDGKIVIGGDFNTFNNDARKGIARLTGNGSLDASFIPGLGPDDLVNAIKAQGSNLILGGYFTEFSGTPQNGIARLQSSGILDTNFHSGTGADGPVLSIAVQPDGKIIIGGAFTTFDGFARTNIARLNSDGSLDPGFDPGSGVAGEMFSTVNCVALQPDGKVIIGGAFSEVNGVPRSNLARLNTNGLLDMTFATSIGLTGAGILAGVYGLAVQSDGKVLVAGDFTSINGTARTNLARITSGGVLDASFNAGGGPDGAVNSIAVQNNGRILLAGFFTHVNGTNRNYIARLMGDGQLDSTFAPPTGADDAIYTTTLQPDGQVFIGGLFTMFDGTPRRGIARLHGDTVIPAPQLLNPSRSNNTFQVSVATVAGKSYILQFKDALSDANWSSLPGVPGDGTIKTLSDVTATGPRRLYRVHVQ